MQNVVHAIIPWLKLPADPRVFPAAGLRRCFMVLEKQQKFLGPVRIFKDLIGFFW